MAQDDDPTNRSYDRANDVYADKLSNVSETLNRLEKKPSEADKKDESVKKQEQKPEDSHATVKQVSKPRKKKQAQLEGVVLERFVIKARLVLFLV